MFSRPCMMLQLWLPLLAMLGCQVLGDSRLAFHNHLNNNIRYNQHQRLYRGVGHQMERDVDNSDLLDRSQGDAKTSNQQISYGTRGEFDDVIGKLSQLGSTRFETNSMPRSWTSFQKYLQEFDSKMELKEALKIIEYANLARQLAFNRNQKRPSEEQTSGVMESRSGQPTMGNRNHYKPSEEDDDVSNSSIVVGKRSAALQCVMSCLHRGVTYVRCHSLCN